MTDPLYDKIKDEIRREYDNLCLIKKFEPNDQATRTCFEEAITVVLRKYVAQRFIVDFKIVCDNSNNTAEMLDQNLPPAVDVYFTNFNRDFRDPKHIALNLNGGYH